MSHAHDDRAATLGRIGGTPQSLLEILGAFRAQLPYPLPPAEPR